MKREYRQLTVVAHFTLTMPYVGVVVLFLVMTRGLLLWPPNWVLLVFASPGIIIAGLWWAVSRSAKTQPWVKLHQCPALGHWFIPENTGVAW
jgi:hypothetical protein